ncbi:hypothetical protein QNH14_18510 [Apirhabdus apintestini]|nr:hypothetical protein QNH14_18510 [Enterobacteriaceae bacterium CA-0114]
MRLDAIFTPNPKPQTPNPKPQTPNPKPQTPNPKPQTPNLGKWLPIRLFFLTVTNGAKLIHPSG